MNIRNSVVDLRSVEGRYRFGSKGERLEIHKAEVYYNSDMHITSLSANAFVRNGLLSEIDNRGQLSHNYSTTFDQLRRSSINGCQAAGDGERLVDVYASRRNL